MAEPVIWTLRMLGGLTLQAPPGSAAGRAGQRRRLALLAILARAPGRQASRDRLVGLLWPEATSVESRRSLSSALYDLRTALGDTAIQRVGDDVRLDAAVLRTDVDSLEVALTRGDPETALDLYRGPFLDGIHIAAAWSFDQWMEEERQRLRGRLVQAVTRDAERRMQAGDAANAAALLQRLAGLEPVQTDLALRLAAALEAAGDRAAAVQGLIAHSDRIRHLLDLEPDPEIQEMVRRLRTPPAPQQPSKPAESASDTDTDSSPSIAAVELSGAPSTSGGEPVPAGSSQPDRLVLASRPSPIRSRRWRLRTLGWSAVTLAGLVLLGWAVHWARGPSRPASTAATDRALDDVRVVVLPFRTAGSPAFATFADGAAHLLAERLDGIGPLRAVDAATVATWSRDVIGDGTAAARDTTHTALVARRFGADLVVSSTIWASDERIRVLATLHDTDGARLGESSAEGVPGAFPALVDTLGVRLVALALADEVPALRAAVGQTASLPAIAAWLEGERLFRAGRFMDAEDAFRAAVARDSTFALAHYRLALATLWADRPGARPAEVEAVALRHAERLPSRERRLIEAYAAWRRGNADRAESLYRRMLDDGDDIEAWFQLGETLFHYNPTRGRPVAESRAAFLHVLESDPDHWGALWHLAQLDALAGETGRFFAMLDHLLDLEPDSDRALELRLLRALDPSPATARIDPSPRMDGVERERLAGAAWRAAVHLKDADAARRLLEPLTTRPSANDRAVGEAMIGWLDLAEGRVTAARSRAHRTRLIASGGWFAWIGAELEGYSYLPPFPPPEPETLARLIQDLDSLALTPEVHQFRVARYPTLLAGLLEATGGALDDARLADRMRRIETIAGRDGVDARPVAEALLAWVTWLDGDLDATLHHLARSREHVWFADALVSPSPGGAFFRYLHGQALVAAGRTEESWPWFRSLAESVLPDVAWWRPGLSHYEAAVEETGGRDAAPVRFRYEPRR